MKIPTATAGKVSLYFHIPFCSRKCPYCHFYSIPYNSSLEEDFLQAICREWQMRSQSIIGHSIVSIYFGGGTPTCLSPKFYSRILSMIRSSDSIEPSCEITIEANPENLSHSQFELFRAAGINRISIGAQSFDDNLLKKLGRPHSAALARQAIFDASHAGFSNISVDLMYDLPGQDLLSWEKTLNNLADLPICHCSIYNLTIEPHTSYYCQKHALQKEIPTPDVSLMLLQAAIDRLKAFSLNRYEISAFAKDDMYSRHNTGYWIGRPFLGFGPSAFSYWEGKRFQNVANIRRYLRAIQNQQCPVAFSEELPYPANVNELFTINLRMLCGIEEDRWPLPHDTLCQLSRLEHEEFVKRVNGRWMLTDKGLLFYDTVAEELI